MEQELKRTLQKEFNADQHSQELPNKFYIFRTLEANIIYDIFIISDIIQIGCIFLVTNRNHSREAIEEIVKDNFIQKIPVINVDNISSCSGDLNSIILIDEEQNSYIALNEFRKIHPEKNVYFFKMCSKYAELESLLSIGPDIQVLSKPKKKEIKPDSFSFEFFNKINILCADPGTGKSTTLKEIHNQLLNRNYYPKLISLKDHVEFFIKFSINDNAESILKQFLNSDNEASLDQLLKEGKICLLFDGMNELDFQYLNNAIESIKKLLNLNLRIWISSRKDLKEQLENVFKVNIFDFGLITENEQRKYIEERLNSSFGENQIKNVIKNIYQENFTLFKVNSDILGIPLLLYITTQVLIDNIDNEDIDFKNLLNLSKLIDRFLFKGKIEDKLYDEINYGIVALKLCLNESDFNGLKIQNYDKIIQDVKNSENVKILEQQTFAEYFCALYFSNNIQTDFNLKNFIFQPKYKVIWKFLNLKLSEDLPLHLSVIYRDVESIKKANFSEIKSSKDIASRNLLQLAISCSDLSYPIWKLMNFTNYPNHFLYEKFDKNHVIYIEPEEIKIDIELENIFKYLCSFCDFEQVDELLKWTSYEYAIKMNNLSLINILLDFKPNNSLLQDYCLNQKESVLGYSAKYGLINLVKVFCLKLSIGFINEVKFTNNELFGIGWCTALDLAVMNNRVDYVKYLIANNIEVNSRNVMDWIALHFAARKGHLQCLQELTEKSEINSKDYNGLTPLHFAAKKGHLQCLRELISKNAEVNSKDTSLGWLPLHYSAQKGHLECLQELISKNSDVNSKDSENWTPLHLSSQNGHLRCVQELIANNAEVNCKDSGEWTALHFAAIDGHLDCMKELIEKGCDVNSRNSYGWSALHYVAKKGYLECVRALIDGGGDVNCKDSRGWTPSFLAAENGHLECVEELVARGADDGQVVELNGASGLDVDT